MKCAWHELQSILPDWIRCQLDSRAEQSLQELRLRLGQAPQLNEGAKSRILKGVVCQADLQYCLNTASRYSPWSAHSMQYGFLTAPGGHRIGICGEVASQQDSSILIRTVSSLNVRVARDFPGIAKEVSKLGGSILLIGPPGSGKTTMLRDLIRQRAVRETVCVVDERLELFPKELSSQLSGCIDVISGCSKPVGIETALRTMGPSFIAVDEITAQNDCAAVISASRCGVSVLATIHAANLSDLKSLPFYNPLLHQNIFDHFLILRRDKSWVEAQPCT